MKKYAYGDIPLHPTEDDMRLAAINLTEVAGLFSKQYEAEEAASFAQLARAASHYLEMCNEAGVTPGAGCHRPIVRAWVSQLGLRHQGTLMSAIRGCDGTPKDRDPSKWIMRFLRSCVLRAHVGDPAKAASYMVWTDDFEEFWRNAKEFLNDFDQYPLHFVLHVMQAAEVCGYCMSTHSPQSAWWFRLYQTMCRKLHLTPETREEMNLRLNAAEQDFGAAQKV